MVAFGTHFLDTAHSVGFNSDSMQSILDDMQTELPKAIERLAARLPEGFPKHITEAIFDNSIAMLNKLNLSKSNTLMEMTKKEDLHMSKDCQIRRILLMIVMMLVNEISAA